MDNEKISLREYYRLTMFHVRLIQTKINTARKNIAGYRYSA